MCHKLSICAIECPNPCTFKQFVVAFRSLVPVDIYSAYSAGLFDQLYAFMVKIPLGSSFFIYPTSVEIIARLTH